MSSAVLAAAMTAVALIVLLTRLALRGSGRRTPLGQRAATPDDGAPDDLGGEGSRQSDGSSMPETSRAASAAQPASARSPSAVDRLCALAEGLERKVGAHATHSQGDHLPLRDASQAMDAPLPLMVWRDQGEQQGLDPTREPVSVTDLVQGEAKSLQLTLPSTTSGPLHVVLRRVGPRLVLLRELSDTPGPVLELRDDAPVRVGPFHFELLDAP